jgi:hypothetical protein
LLPAGAKVAGRDSHPLKNSAFSRRTTYNTYKQTVDNNWSYQRLSIEMLNDKAKGRGGLLPRPS